MKPMKSEGWIFRKYIDFDEMKAHEYAIGRADRHGNASP